jgi:hypothetical protein
MQPNFMIIGAAKSGTTSLADYLDQHPEIYMCPGKEPNYFALAGATLPPAGPVSPEIHFKHWYTYTVTDYAKYLALFDKVTTEKAVGDASVRYLYFPEAASRIAEAIPQVRLIAILREPVSRLYSHYCMNVQYQMEPLELPEAIAAETGRIQAKWGWDWHYVGVSKYAGQLKRFFQHFAKEQIKVFLYDDFVKEPVKVFQEICSHIGVDRNFVPDMSQKGKVAYRPKNLALDRWLHWPREIRPGIARYIPRRLPEPIIASLRHWNSAPIPKIDSSLRAKLREHFVEDVREVESILGRKTNWLG